jgi:hypothetical protein
MDETAAIPENPRVRRWFGRLLRLGAIAAIGYAAVRVVRAARRELADGARGWEAGPFPYPPVPAVRGDELAPSAPASDGDARWVEPVDGACPASYPVKVKTGSGIFHVPGGASYERTRPDRCYCDAAAAVADGYRAARR